MMTRMRDALRFIGNVAAVLALLTACAAVASIGG